MSLGIIAGLLALATGIMSYISYLKSKLESHQNIIEILKSEANEKEWASQIKDLTKTVKETDIDYKKASDDFRNKYNGSGSNGTGNP